MKTNKMSLNPIPSIIQYVDIIDEFKQDCKTARQMFGFKLSFDDWIEHKQIDIDKEVQKPVDMVSYYQRVKRRSTGKFMNYT